jgi:hypothetical protein
MIFPHEKNVIAAIPIREEKPVAVEKEIELRMRRRSLAG